VAARTDKRLGRRIHPIILDYHAAIRRAWTQAFVESGLREQKAAEVYEVILHTVRGMALAWLRAPRPIVNKPLVARVVALLEKNYR
jgi:hypothetical protein